MINKFSHKQRKRVNKVNFWAHILRNIIAQKLLYDTLHKFSASVFEPNLLKRGGGCHTEKLKK